MKTKPVKNSGRGPFNIPPIPNPLELAKLAAILSPDSTAKEAMKKAMQFYISAVHFSQELPSNLDDLVDLFGNEDQRTAARLRRCKKELGPILEKKFGSMKTKLKLDPTQNDDEVRQFLARNGLQMKTIRAVKENILKVLEQTIKPDRRGTYNFDDCFPKDQRISHYLIPEYLCAEVVRHSKKRKAASRVKSWRTRKNRKKIRKPSTVSTTRH